MNRRPKGGSAELFAREFGASASVVNGLLGNVSKPQKTERDIALRTGVASLDAVLGGGLPSGITELFGGMSVGKTAAIAAITRTSQRDGLEVLYAPTESREEPYLERLGVDLSNLAVVFSREPEFLEACLEDFFKTGKRRLVVLDSINAVGPYDQGQFVWNEWAYDFLLRIRDCIPPGSALVLTSQARMQRAPDGSFEKQEESASRRVTDMYDVRLELLKTKIQEKRYTLIAHVVANVNRKPGLHVELPVYKGCGIEVERDLIWAAVKAGVIRQKGSWYYYDIERLGNGIEEAILHLVEKPHIREYIEKRLRGPHK